MASYINTNYASLQAQNNLANSQNSLQTSIERLSSGLRINSAADDAAGLAISDRMTSQINGLNQAAQNANDGISLAQTADGALSSVSSDLQRIRQLAVESANSTNSSSDRASLNQESTQLLSEVQRIATTTQFNGLNLLDGSFAGQQFQVGANANQTISVNLGGALTTSLGSYGGKGQAVSSSGWTAGVNQISVNGTTIGVSVGTDATHGLTDGSAAAKAAAINEVSSTTGVTATASTTTTGGALTASTSLNAGDVTINGVALGAVAGSTNLVTQGQNFAAAVNAISATTGVTASADSSTGKLTLSAADGRDIMVKDNTTGATGTNIAAYGFAENGAGTLNANTYYATGTVSLSSPSAIALANVGTSTAGLADAGLDSGTTNTSTTSASGGAGAAQTTGYSASLQSLSNVDLSTVDGANSALSVIDGAISQIDSQRAVLGATSNRFQATVSNLDETSSNLSSSRSRIQDTDYAAETANLSQAQILQQAGTAMLTQANSLPNSVLTLLKG